MYCIVSYGLLVVDDSRHGNTFVAASTEISTAVPIHGGFGKLLFGVDAAAVEDPGSLVWVQSTEQGNGCVDIRSLNLCPATPERVTFNAERKEESVFS